MPHFQPAVTVTLRQSDYQALLQRVRDLEDRVRIERRRAAQFEETAARAYRAATWGGARRTRTPEERV